MQPLNKFDKVLESIEKLQTLFDINTIKLKTKRGNDFIKKNNYLI